MEFLQRHLPRVYQAVQDALNFFTNITAQIFGAPPDAPQPRNARSNVPIQTPKEYGGPPEEEEVCGSMEAELSSSAPELSSAKEEDGDGAKDHAGDKDNQTWDLRHRNSDPGGRRDLEHKTDGADSTILRNKVTSSQVQIILHQEQLANPPDQLKLNREYQEVVVPCEIKVSQYEEDELIPKTVQNSEYKVYKDAQPIREPSSDDQHEKRVFQPMTLKNLSFEDEKQLVAITGQERPAEKKMKCVIKLTTESEEYTIDTEHETEVLADSIESMVTVECDSDKILDVIEINKKLVTPVDETEVSFYSQVGDSKKTLEDLLETANRLAKHCVSVHNIEEQKGSDNIRDLNEMPGSIPEQILSKEQGFTEEVLTSVDEILAKCTLLKESGDHKPINLEEETTQELFVLEQGGFSGEGNSKVGEEMSTMDKNVQGEATNKEEVQEISEEKHQSEESKSQPKMSKKQRGKKRVHFSPSTEDLFKKSERSPRSTFRMVSDDILENELNASRENPEQLESSYIIRDLDLYPNKEDKVDYFGVTTCRDDDGQSTSEEEQTAVIDDGRAVWYDDYSAHGEHDKRCESLGDVIIQQMQVDSKMESFVAVTERQSTKEPLDHIPFREEISSAETEHVGNLITSKNEHKEFFSEDQMESHETVNNTENESSRGSDGVEETVSKEDIFLEETKGQIDDLLEGRTDLLEYGTADVNEDDTSQSKNILETNLDGSPKDFTDETDTLFLEQSNCGQNYPEMSSTEYYKAEKELTLDQFSLQETDKHLKSDHHRTEVQEIFSSEDVLKSSEEEAGSSIVQLNDTLLDTGNSNQERKGGLLSGEHIEVLGDFEGENELHNETEQEQTNNEQNYGFQQKTSTHEMEDQQEHTHYKPSYDHHEDFSKGWENEPQNETKEHQEQSNDNTNYDFQHEDIPPDAESEPLSETATSEMEELQEHTHHKPSYDQHEDLPPDRESVSLKEIATSEMEEQQERTHDRLNYDFNHEDFPPERENESHKKTVTHELEEQQKQTKNDPNHDFQHEVPLETNESQQEDSQCKVGHIRVELLTEEQHVADVQYVAGDEGHGNEQIQDDKSLEKLVPTDGNEECHEASHDTDQNASVNEVCTSISQDVLIREGLVSEECTEILKDPNFKMHSESCNEICEVREYRAVKQNYDYIHKDFQLDTRESEEGDLKVSTSHAEVQNLHKEQFGAEEQLLVTHDEDPTVDVSSNEKFQEDQGQPVFRDSDDVYHKEMCATEQSTSEVEVSSTIVEYILKKEDQVSEEFNDIFKEENVRTESEPLNEIMTHKVLTHNDDIVQEYLQPDATALSVEDIKVTISHIEEEFVTEEPLVLLDEALQPEGYRNDQAHEDQILNQTVSVESDDASLNKLHETELNLLAAEISTSIAKEVLTEDSLISEKGIDVFGKVSFTTECKPNSETLTFEPQEHTDGKQNDYIFEDVLIKTNKSEGVNGEVDIGHLTEDQLVADIQFKGNEETFTTEGSNSHHLKEDILPAQPVFRDNGDGSPKKLHEIERRPSLNEICTSIVEDILTRDVPISEESREAFIEPDCKEESIVQDKPSTCEMDERQDHIAEEQDNDLTTEVSLTETNKSQDEEVKTAHLEIEHVTEGQFVAEEPFETTNKDSPIKQSSTGDQFQEDKLHEGPNSRDSHEIFHNKLSETEQSSSNKTSHIEEEFLKEEHFVAEQKMVVDDDHTTEDSLTETNKSQDDEIKTTHLEKEHVSEEPFEITIEDSSIERSSTGDQFQEDKLHEEPDLRDSDETFHNKPSETEQSSSNKTSHIEEEFLKEEHFVAEQKMVVDDDHTTEDSLTETNKSEDDEIKTTHLDIEHVAEEPFEITIEDSLIKRSSTGDQFQEDKLHEEPDSRDSDEIFLNKLSEIEQSSSNKTSHIEEEFLKEEHFVAEQKLLVDDEGSAMEGSCYDQQEDKLHGQPVFRDSNKASHLELYAAEESPSMVEMCTSVVEDILVRGDLVSEESGGVFKDVDATLESQSYHKTTICEVQEHLDFHLDSQESIDSTDRTDHIQDKMPPIEQFVVTDEGSPEKGSSQDKVQEGTLLVQPASNKSNEMQHASLIEGGPSNNIHEAGPEEGSSQDHLLLLSFSNVNNEKGLCASVIEVFPSIEECCVVTEEASPEKGSSQDQLQDGTLLAQHIPRNNNQTELSSSVTEVCSSITENVPIREGLGSKEHAQVFAGEGLHEANNMGTFTFGLEEPQEHKPDEKDTNNIYNGLLTETSKPQGDGNDTNTVYIEPEHIADEQFGAKEQFEVPNRASSVVEPSADQLQEESLLHTVSKENDEETYEIEESASVVEICTSNVDDVPINESLVSEELSGTIQDTNYEAQSESLNETSMLDVQDGYRHEDFQSETGKPQEEDSRYKAGDMEAGILTEEQFVVIDEFGQVQGDSNDQLQEERLQQEHAVEKQVEEYIDSLTEATKSEVDESAVNTGHVKAEHIPQEQFVNEETFQNNITFQKKGASTSDHIAEAGQLVIGDIDKISPEMLQTSSVTEICTSVVEDVQMKDYLLSEEHSNAFTEVNLRNQDRKPSTCEEDEEEQPQEHKEVELLPTEQVVVELSLGDEGGDHTEEKHDPSNETNNMYIKDGEQYRPQDHLKLEQESSDQVDYHQDIYPLSEAHNSITGHVLESTMDQDKISPSHENLDLTPEINSLIPSNLLDQNVKVSSEGPDARLDIQNVQNLMLPIAKESGDEMDNESYNVVEVKQTLDFDVKKVSKSYEELDVLSETQCVLSPDHTVHTISEIMGDLDSTKKLTILTEDQSGTYSEDQTPEEIKDLEGPSESYLEGYPDVNYNLELLSETQCVLSPVDTTHTFSELMDDLDSVEKVTEPPEDHTGDCTEEQASEKIKDLEDPSESHLEGHPDVKDSVDLLSKIQHMLSRDQTAHMLPENTDNLDSTEKVTIPSEDQSAAYTEDQAPEMTKDLEVSSEAHLEGHFDVRDNFSEIMDDLDPSERATVSPEKHSGTYTEKQAPEKTKELDGPSESHLEGHLDIKDNFDLLSEIQCVLSPVHTACEYSEIMDDLDSIEKVTEPPEDHLEAYAEEQTPDKTNDINGPFKSNIEGNFDVKNNLDLLSDHTIHVLPEIINDLDPSGKVTIFLEHQSGAYTEEQAPEKTNDLNVPFDLKLEGRPDVIDNLDLLSETQYVLSPGHTANRFSEIMNTLDSTEEVTEPPEDHLQAYVEEQTPEKTKYPDDQSKLHLEGHSDVKDNLNPLSDYTLSGHPKEMDDFDPSWKVTVYPEDISGAFAEEQASEKTEELDGPLESCLEGHPDFTDNWKSNSDSSNKADKDLMLEIHTKFETSNRLEESDVRAEKAVDGAETEHHLTLGHSENERHIILQTSRENKQVDNECHVTSTETFRINHGQVNQQGSPSQAVLEEVMNLDVRTSAEHETSFTSELYGLEMDIKSPTEASQIQQEVDIVIEVQPSTDEEPTIDLHKVEHANTEHKEALPAIQTTCLENIDRDQEQTLVDGSTMSAQRAVQKEEDIFSKAPFHSTLDVSAQKNRVLLLRKTSVRRRPGQRPVTLQEDLPDPTPPVDPPLKMGVPVFPEKMLTLSSVVPPDPESSYPTEEATETILRRKSSIRRRQRPATYQEDLTEPSLPEITSSEPTHPTEEPSDDSAMSEQKLDRKSLIWQPWRQPPVAFEDKLVEPPPPMITPLKMGVPNFLGGMPILPPAMAPESSHHAEEPKDEANISETMLRRKSSIRRPKGKQPVTSDEQTIEPPPQSITAPMRMGVPLFPGVPAHVTQAPVSSHPTEEPEEEHLTIKPKKGFLKHAGFGGAHPGMMQELQARLHKKKPKE